MPFDNFMALLLVLEFWVEISRALSSSYYVVVGPLVRVRESECVVNEISVVFFGGAALTSMSRGRATPSKTSTFDSTMGFPGEDVA